MSPTAPRATSNTERENHPRPRLLISDLCAVIETYLPPEQVKEVYRAYLFGAEAHAGQKRMSGEPYIYHPIEVAHILAGLHLDYQTLEAAILHDVMEDTGTVKAQVAAEFGANVAELVDGVSKLTQMHFGSKAEAEAENYRKMLLAMTRDIRVIIIKLADRLHNMRTLYAMPPDKRRRIARETLDIYVPIANRLGMNGIRLELEDLGFAALYPLRARILAEAVKKARGNRKEILATIETALKRRLRQEEIEARVASREKHLYSLYRKMRAKALPFTEVMDVYAFRIVVDKVDTCYRALGAMHNLYKPVPGKFKDYIAIPKANGYQSLHTVLFGPYGVPIEVQIRSEDMDSVAESGVAAHWQYKSGGNSAEARAREWLKGLLEMQKNAGDSLEFIENVKIDLFPDEVYVFTPKGKIMALPRGATAVDFAYAVHTVIGNSCIAARIDRKLAPLRTPLHNGQTVEIVTAPGAHPNPLWLNFVVTGKARASIRHYLKNLQKSEAVEFGRRLLDKALNDSGASHVPVERYEALLREYHLKTRDDLCAEIGLGNRMAMLVARRLQPAGEVVSGAASAKPLAIRGTEGIVVSYAKCCRPIPGDRIVGYVSAGRGLVIHAEGCKNREQRISDQWIDVQWADPPQGEFPVEIRVEVANRRGVLATVALAIAELGCNIEYVNIAERDGMTSALHFTLDVSDRRQLARVMRHIRAVPQVMRIQRMKH